MGCNCRFFFDDCQGYTGVTTGNFKTCCQADDTGADDRNLNLRRDGDLTGVESAVEVLVIAAQGSILGDTKWRIISISLCDAQGPVNSI
jgi:hypothetical protein